MTLQRAFGIAAAFLGLIALVASSLVFSLTRSQADLTRQFAASTEGIRTSRDLYIGLMLHPTMRDATTRAAIAGGIRASLARARRNVQNVDEGRVVRELEDAVNQYLTGLRPDMLEKALVLARQLTDVNTFSAADQELRAEQINRIAGAAGTATVIFFILGVVGLIVGARTWVIQPVLRLTGIVKQYATGRPDVRATADGPAEIRELALTGNAMMDSLQRIRHRQLEYLAGVMHDLRIPMTSIQLVAAYFPPDQPLPPEAGVRKLIGMIHHDVTRMNSIIGDVLNTARIEAGEMQLLLEDTDARRIAEVAAETFRALAPTHRIEAEVPEAPVRLRGDRAQIEQVLNSLVSNAVKFSPAGSCVRIMVSKTERIVRFTVTDQGKGISPIDLQRVFQPFRRTPSGHEGAAGVGLSLYVSRRIAEAHGGHLNVSSTVGRGSTFTLDLPEDGPEEVAAGMAA